MNPVHCRNKASFFIAFALIFGVIIIAACKTNHSEDAQEHTGEILCINFHCLEGDNLQAYYGFQHHIEKTLHATVDASSTKGAMLQLRLEINQFPFASEFRQNLDKYIGQEAFHNRKLSDPLIFEMISSNEEAFQSWALDYLTSFIDSLQQEPVLINALIDVIGDKDIDGYVKLNIFWLFQSMGDVEVIRDKAMNLISSTSDAGLAHDVAFVLLVDDQYNREKLTDIFHSSIGALRQKAAIIIASHPIANDSPEREALAEVEGIAKNKDMPARVRGEALEAIGSDVQDPLRRAILLSMLEKDQWFFGAQGAHFKIHSLALVIQSLKSINDSQIRQILKELKPQLAALRSGEREYVEWVLDNALGINRPYFGGPVDPDSIP